MKLVINIFLILLCSFSALGQTEYYVLFEYDEAEVPDTAMAFIIKTVYTNEVKNIYLEGHCDSVGSRVYNYDLSERRVKAVEKLLVDNGFDKNKIEGKVGFGKDKPITPNNTDEARQKNRRVLVKFDIEKKLAFQSNFNELSSKEVIAKNLYKDEDQLGIPIDGNSFGTEKKFSLQEPAVRPKELKRENFTTNSTIALPNLLFMGGRHILMHGSHGSLDTLLQILNEKPKLRIEIQGHVCCTTFQLDGFDWDTRTDDLSEQRARAIQAFLVRQGISSTRLRIKGYGGSRKLFPLEENDYQRQQNRRVEVMVLEE